MRQTFTGRIQVVAPPVGGDLPPPGHALLVAPADSHQVIRPAIKTAAQWNGSLFESYGSGTFNPYYSTIGAYVMTGTGGHNHQETFGAAVWDWSDRSWKWHDCTQMPERNTPVQLHETDGEPWMEMAGTQVPAPTHPFRSLTVIPPELGAGPQGDMMYLGRGSTANSWDPAGIDPVSWSYASKSAHRFSFETGEWRRAMDTLMPWVHKNTWIEGNTVHDPVTNYFHHVPSHLETLDGQYYLNGNNWQWEISHFAGGKPPNLDTEINYGAATYGIAGGKRIILHAHSYIVRILDLDDIAAGWSVINYTGIMPTVHGSVKTERDVGTQNAWVFHVDQGVFYLRMHNWANQRLFRLTPPASNPRTSPWHVTQIQMAGDAIPEYAGPPAPFNKGSRALHYIPQWKMLGWVTKNGVALINPTKDQPGNQPSALDRPVCTVRPVATGTPAVGQTMFCDTGTWINDPTSFEYQWIVKQEIVSTTPTYTIKAEDVGKMTRCIVSAINGNGEARLACLPFTPVAEVSAPANLTPPSIVGEARVGETLVADLGEWSGNPAPRLTAVWRANAGSFIAGGPTYTVDWFMGPNQFYPDGQTLFLEVHADNGVGGPVIVRTASVLVLPAE